MDDFNRFSEAWEAYLNEECYGFQMICPPPLRKEDWEANPFRHVPNQDECLGIVIRVTEGGRQRAALCQFFVLSPEGIICELLGHSNLFIIPDSNTGELSAKALNQVLEMLTGMPDPWANETFKIKVLEKPVLDIRGICLNPF